MNSNYLYAVAGGALIGLSATLYLLLQGRISGISGILGNALDPALSLSGRLERFWFLLGLALIGLPLYLLMPTHFQQRAPASPLVVLLAGLLVGIGTRLSNGCTSGHGVCGISRGSTRSIIATLTFIATGALAVGLLRLFGGHS